MRNYFSLLLLSLAFVSCDVVDEPLKAGSQNPTDTGSVDEKLLQKKVLLEEFTGVTCNNCPEAAKDVRQILNLYPGQVVAMGIHAGGFANPNPADGYPDDLRTPEGNAIFSFANPAGVPSGLIDREDYGTSSFVKFRNSWRGSVGDILGSKAQTDLIINPSISYNEASRELDLSVNFEVRNDLAAAEVWWVAMITEDEVITAQKLPDNSRDSSYSQEHVLRTSFNNAAFGLPLNLNSNAAGEEKNVSAQLTLNNDWKAEDCHVVIYAYDKNTNAIIQVEELAL